MGFVKLAWLITHGARVIVLVVLYSLANLVTYYALARVEASVYSVLLQVLIYFAPLLPSPIDPILPYHTYLLQRIEAEDPLHRCFRGIDSGPQYLDDQVAGAAITRAELHLGGFSGLQLLPLRYSTCSSPLRLLCIDLLSLHLLRRSKEEKQGAGCAAD